eukprot:15430876-Alexandrium_andersonii.AAC.1
MGATATGGVGRLEALAVLGFADGTPSGDVVAQMKAAYRRLAAQHHPDKGGDAATMQRLNEARDVLSEIGYFGLEADPEAQGGEASREQAARLRAYQWERDH